MGMIKANLQEIRGGAVLAIVMNGHGAYESVTVYVPYQRREDATKWDSIFGPVDICYSWRSTYRMLDRKKSGFYTGIPLKGETFIVTDKEDALRQAEALYNRKGKVHLVYHPNAKERAQRAENDRLMREVLEARNK